MHIVWTVDGSNWVFYKNGAVADTTSSGQQPLSLTRAQHWIGRSAWISNGYFDGTIAYLRLWHGTALTDTEIAVLYANRETKNPNIFSAPTTTVVDECDSSITGSLMNGARITPKRLSLDGVDDYVDLTPWEFGGPTTVETYVKYDSVENITIMNFEVVPSAPAVSEISTLATVNLPTQPNGEYGPFSVQVNGADITMTEPNFVITSIDTTDPDFLNKTYKIEWTSTAGTQHYGCLLYTSPSPRD